jgi:hypothetical protein
MKKRDPFIVLLLSLITGGIYNLYWLYVTRREIVTTLNNEKAIWPVWILLSPILGVIAALALYMLIAIVLGFQGTFVPHDTPLMNTVIFLFGAASIIAFIVVPIMWMHRYCKALATAIHSADSSTSFTIWILLTIFGVGFIWNLLTQIDINKFVGTQPVAATTNPML